jgi:uncharacterized protein (DUF433 family)
VKVDYEAIQTDPALRRGLYSLSELTSYLSLDEGRRLSGSTVGRWAQHALAGVEHRPRRPDYSFADLISMLVVRDLVRLGLRPTDIREAELFLRERYGHEHPFVSMRLKTDGVDVFYEAAPSIAEQLTAANRRGQEVLKPTIAHALNGVTYEHGLAAAWRPAEGIVLDPTIQFGEPCIAETGVTTRQLAVLASSSNASPVDLARTYGVREHEVRRALEFERRLADAA